MTSFDVLTPLHYVIPSYASKLLPIVFHSDGLLLHLSFRHAFCRCFRKFSAYRVLLLVGYWLCSLFWSSLSLVSSIAMTSPDFYLLNYTFFFSLVVFLILVIFLSLVSSTAVLYLACHPYFSSGSCLLWREFFRCVSHNFWSLLPVLQCHVIIPTSSDL